MVFTCNGEGGVYGWDCFCFCFFNNLSDHPWLSPHSFMRKTDAELWNKGFCENHWWKKNAINISFLIISVIRWSFFMIKVSNERAENEFFSNLIIFYKFEHRWPNEFLTSQLHIVVIHSCVKYVSYEWYHRKEETLSFTDMCHLWIIIVVKIWLYIDQSRFRLFWDTLYMYLEVQGGS